MNKSPRRILLVSHETDIKPKLQADPAPKMAKGFIRLGHDARQISYTSTMAQLSPFKSRPINHRFFKDGADKALGKYAEHYKPDIVFIGFSRGLDKHTVRALRAAAPEAVFFGWDGDPWPSNNPVRIEVGCELDLLFATNNGSFLDEYRQSGARKCLFMPNLIDPDIDRHYSVEKKWHSDILWTGKAQHQKGIDAGETCRQDVLERILERPNVKIYGCLDYPKIGGIDYFCAISGAKIGISVNAINTIPLYHSDRFTHYSAAGTMALAKHVPDTEQLMEHKKHAVYFESEEECIDLADWYLKHDKDRQKIADAGMRHCHANYSVEQIAGHILSAIDNGEYDASWGKFVAS